MSKKTNARQDRLRDVSSALKTFQQTVSTQLDVGSDISELKGTIEDLTKVITSLSNQVSDQQQELNKTNKNVKDMADKADSHQTYMEAVAKVNAMREKEKEREERHGGAAGTKGGAEPADRINYMKMILAEMVRMNNSQETFGGVVTAHFEQQVAHNKSTLAKQDELKTLLSQFIENSKRKDTEEGIEGKLRRPVSGAPNSPESEEKKSSGFGLWKIFSGLAMLLGGLAITSGRLLGNGLMGLGGGLKDLTSTVLGGLFKMIKGSLTGIFKSGPLLGSIGSRIGKLGSTVIGGLFKMLRGTIGGLFKAGGAIMNMMSHIPFVGGILKLFGKFLGPINFIMSFIQGAVDFFDTDGIAKKLGVGKDKVSLLDRLMNGLAGFAAKFIGTLIDPILGFFGIKFSVEDFMKDGFTAIEKAIDSSVRNIQSKGFTKWAGDLTGSMMKSAEAMMKSMWDSVIGSITAMKDGILDWLENQDWMPDVAKNKIKEWRAKTDSKPSASDVPEMLKPVKMYDDTSNATSSSFDPSKSGIFGHQAASGGVPFYELHPASGPNDDFTNPSPVYKPVEGNDIEANLLNMIGQKESGGNYNIIYGGENIPLTDMSIGEVLHYQDNNMKNGSTAVGKYQFIRSTLEEAARGSGLNMNDTFSPENQDKMAVFLLKRRGLDEYRSGRLSEKQFASNLALEWASLPTINGKSAYEGVMGNKALISYADMMGTITGDGGSGSQLIDSQRNTANTRTTQAQKPVQVQQINNVQQSTGNGNVMSIALRNDEPSFKKIIEQLAFNSMGVTGSPLFNS